MTPRIGDTKIRLMKKKHSSLTFPLVVLAIILTILIYFAHAKQQFPDLKDPKNMAYSWSYDGRSYSLSMTLYGSVYDYYRREPKGVFVGEEEASLHKYLVLPPRDSSIKEVSAKLNELAAANGLSDDQKLELAASFVQNIPYDEEKAKTDLSHPRYPYEVLYDDKGICSDKSFLMYDILRQMGYGAAVFEYPQETHMNVGVTCPAQYSNDSSGYAVIETTNPKIKIGVIPSLDRSSRQALGSRAVTEFNQSNSDVNTGKQLSDAHIYAKTTGKQYYGIIQTYQNEREVADIQDYLTKQRPVIRQKENELSLLQKQMDYLKAGHDIRGYNALVSPYNQLAGEVGNMVDDYNAKVYRYKSLNE